MSRAADWRLAFDKQMDLWNFWTGPHALDVAEGYMRSVKVTGHGTTLNAAQLAEAQARLMLHADPVAIDDDMMTLVENAAKSFPPEPLRQEDILTPVAFVWLPRPLVLRDANSKRLSVRAISWAPVEYRVQSSSDGSYQTGVQQGLMMAYYSWMGDAEHDDFAEHMKMYEHQFNVDMSMAHWEPWMFGRSYEPQPHIPGAGMETLAFTQTMWRLMQQTITTVVKERPDRATRRRADRARLPEKYVTVIRLRRPRREPEEGAEPREVEWSHRWLVSGHWRNQWFPSMQTHRAIWINPYTKGPEDRPLEIRRLRAFEWVR